jgi:hypothetical protein
VWRQIRHVPRIYIYVGNVLYKVARQVMLRIFEDVSDIFKVDKV